MKYNMYRNSVGTNKSISSNGRKKYIHLEMVDLNSNANKNQTNK